MTYWFRWGNRPHTCKWVDSAKSLKDHCPTEYICRSCGKRKELPRPLTTMDIIGFLIQDELCGPIGNMIEEEANSSVWVLI